MAVYLAGDLQHCDLQHSGSHALIEPEVLISRDGAAGVLTLNRPKALNALTHGMVKHIAAALDDWRNDAAVTRVLIRAAGDRAFCAGGDIRVVHDLGRAGRQDEALWFWRDEYRMNRQIKRYPKPYIALIDGIVMGGGVGVSEHGAYRVAGDRYSYAMPEVGIGFFPDVGATYALPRLPFCAGTYLALTGQRIGRADALALGLATHGVASQDMPAVEAALAAGNDIEATLQMFAAPTEAAPILAHSEVIGRIFALPSVAAILDALAAEPGDFAAKTLATMRTKSPFSMALALEQMRRGAAMEFEEAMQTEMRIVTRVVHGHEFYEGVRAVIIDKDQKPQWIPADISGVQPADVAAYFAPIADELTF